MAISNLTGGLGNQMFRFACEYALSLRPEQDLGLISVIFNNIILDSETGVIFKYSKTSRNVYNNLFLRVFYLDIYRAIY